MYYQSGKQVCCARLSSERLTILLVWFNSGRAWVILRNTGRCWRGSQCQSIQPSAQFTSLFILFSRRRLSTGSIYSRNTIKLNMESIGFTFSLLGTTSSRSSFPLSHNSKSAPSLSFHRLGVLSPPNPCDCTPCSSTSSRSECSWG